MHLLSRTIVRVCVRSPPATKRHFGVGRSTTTTTATSPMTATTTSTSAVPPATARVRNVQTGRRKSTSTSTNATADQTDMPTMANVVQGPSLLLTSLHRPEPTLMMLPGLRSLPFWTNSTGQVAYQDPQMTQIVQHLQHHVQDIRAEYQAVAKRGSMTSDYDASSSSSSTTTTTAGTEHADASLHTGSWDWQSYLLHGQVQPQFCEQFPITTRILQGIDPNHLFTKTPFGFCFFSKLSGHSTIQSHTSPVNFRLRIHLPITVPATTPTSTSATTTELGIRVGPMTQTWIPDHAMILDDSYHHEVWNHTDEERVVLLIDIWHPDVRPNERDEIRRMFQHAQQQGWLNPNHKSSTTH